MKVIEIVFGQVTWILDAYLAKKLYLPDVIAKIQAKYGFVQASNPLELLRGDKGAVFEHGSYKNHLIRKLAIYNDGLLAESPDGTDVAEVFMDEFYGWCVEEFSVKKMGFVGEYKYYDSQLTVQMNENWSEKISFLNDLASLLTKMTKKYEVHDAEFHPYGFQLDVERDRNRNLPVAPFKIERRVHFPFSENVFYSVAGLTTKDHIELLKKMDSMLSAEEKT